MAKLKQKSQLTEKSKRILAERKEGKSIDELASIYGISRSRVYQILKAYGDTLPPSLSSNTHNSQPSPRIEIYKTCKVCQDKFETLGSSGNFEYCVLHRSSIE